MATIYIDNQPYEVEDGQNLLEACLKLGFDVPYFCWHPALHSVGACRQCAVKQFRDEKDTRGRIVMACMTPAAEGTRISIADAEVLDFRRSNIAWLMVNHPHDCPVCDEGGECHLQDMTVLTGHNYRKHRFAKRTHINQDLGPLINHEMNRCIQCYRCVRYYRDYAGGRDLNVFGAHDRAYFGRAQSGVLESEFSGNLVEICPTGVFTDKTLRGHHVRKWDMQSAPSICQHCGVGCNTYLGERFGTLRRVVSRYNGEVNGYFLCDLGRFAYEHVNSDQRIRLAHWRHLEEGDCSVGDGLPTSAQQGIDIARQMVQSARGLVGIGSARSSLENNFALRELVGVENFCLGLGEREARVHQLALALLKDGGLISASLHDVLAADGAFVIGEDVNETAPMLALALRQMVRNQPMALARAIGVPEWDDSAVRRAVQSEKGPLFIATPARTRLDDLARTKVRSGPGEITEMVRRVTAVVNGDAGRNAADQGVDDATLIARGLLSCAAPVIVSGVGLNSGELLLASAELVRALQNKGKTARVYLALPGANSLGVGLLTSRSLNEALEKLRGGAADTLVVLETDVFRHLERSMAEQLLGAARQVIVLDILRTETASCAELVLPVATVAESTGTFLSNSLSDLRTRMATAVPELAGITQLDPASPSPVAGLPVARQTYRVSGRTAARAHLDVKEHAPAIDEDSPLTFSNEGYVGPEVPPQLAPRSWVPGWNSWQQSATKFRAEVSSLNATQSAPGIRVFAGQPTGKDVPASYRTEPEQCEGLLLLPARHVFGSEELSAFAPALASLFPQPYLGFAESTLARLGYAAGDEVAFSVNGKDYSLPARAVPELADGLALAPLGLPGMPYLDLPAPLVIEPGGER